MARKVFFDRFGGAEVLSVHGVAEPHAVTGQVRVRVRAAGLNPVDFKIFAGGQTAERFGIMPPCGNGNDLAGVIDEVGPDVQGFSVGDRVYGGARFHAQADYLIVEDTSTLNPVSDGLTLRAAATLDIVGRTAIASVASVGLKPGEVVVVGAAAGGVGVLAAQLALREGARVVGTASPANHDFLRSLGVVPVAYGDGLEDRLREQTPDGIDAVLDCHGADAIEVGLSIGVPRHRMNTVEFAAAKRLGVQSKGRATTRTDAVRPLADLVASGEIVVPISEVYELEDVVAAYRSLMTGHVRGKVVLNVSSD